MNIHEAIYSLSDIGLYLGGGVAGGVAGGDLSAVGGYVREVLHQLVESANRHPSEDHRLLLEVCNVFRCTHSQYRYCDIIIMLPLALSMCI